MLSRAIGGLIKRPSSYVEMATVAFNDNRRWGGELGMGRRQRGMKGRHTLAEVTDYSRTFTRQPFPGLFRGGLERGPNSQPNRYNFAS